ncbi:MAG: transposase [Clostridia bacterium]|nr:transposase [Clostridia bacterium]
MPRKPRKYLETNCYHVMTQGINKKFIFNNSNEKKYYIKKMYEVKEKFYISILAYCIMDNHSHLLLKTNNVKDLSKYMQSINSNYASYFNKMHNRVGYVFRDRFKAEGIYSEKQLYCCMKYIYNNPVKAGLCIHAGDYRFSNYKELNIENESNNEFEFIDYEIEECINFENLFQDFLSKYNINIHELKENKLILKRLVQFLVNDHSISLRKISSELEIPRESIRRLVKN